MTAEIEMRRRFHLSVKEGKGGYISFTADGGDIKISGITGRCYGVDYVACVKRLVRKMIRAPESPPPHIREMVGTVLHRFLQMVQEMGWTPSISVGVDAYIYDEGGPKLSLNIAVNYGPLLETLLETYYDEGGLFDDVGRIARLLAVLDGYNKNKWYITIHSCYCGFDTYYSVERILHLGSGDLIRFDINPHGLRRIVATTVKQTYNAKP